ncbi:MAG: hypothetical protein AAGA75_23070 [Cyanobacteria bacterium P01_E01_bin.6]
MNPTFFCWSLYRLLLALPQPGRSPSFRLLTTLDDTKAVTTWADQEADLE